jgi:rhodanese-related sulfurtransferase
MPDRIDAHTLKSWLSDGSEIALIDVREAGQFGEAHPFFAVPLPYSRFELGLPALAPNNSVRLVLCDAGDGVAERAAKRAEDLGYRNVSILAGGAPAWGETGYTLYAGVNVPSKTFGELVEHRRHTPHITAQQLQAMRVAGENMVIVDGRTYAEFNRMSIPDGISCPNGELALRIRDIAPDPNTKIVVNCAGRTRSIIGAQTLIDVGVPNPIVALENGTQGWFLAGLRLDHGATRGFPSGSADIAAPRARARALAEKHDVAYVPPATVHGWVGDLSHTTYLFDVRTAEEFAADGVPGFAHAPGGQLIQATDQWVGVQGARLALVDGEMVRAPVVAAWLRQLGHEACVIDGGVAAVREIAWPQPERPGPPDLPVLTPQAAASLLARPGTRLFDLRPSMTFRKGHVAQAAWSNRALLRRVADPGTSCALISDEPQIAALFARDLRDMGCRKVVRVTGDLEVWRAAGLEIVATPDVPPDKECIDFLFFTARRHDNDPEAARQYLAWETGLLGQLDAQERGVFRIA